MPQHVNLRILQIILHNPKRLLKPKADDKKGKHKNQNI